MFSTLFVALCAFGGVLASPVEMSLGKEGRGEPDFMLGPHNAVQKRQTPNYNQDYVASGANVQFSATTNGFTATWNTQADFVVGRGWTTGDATPITFGGSFSATSGTGLLSIYGWTTNPLVEYYIMEDTLNPPQQGTIKGTFTSDGGTYTVWEHQQVNQPCITGNSCTFNQYISIRQQNRASGTVTLENHFKQWASYGMTLGAYNYQCLAAETWSGAGSCSQTLSKGAVTVTTTTAVSQTTTAATSTSTSGSTGSCSAKWGQCGGTAWTGPTCCTSSTCTYNNAYYSQCL